MDVTGLLLKTWGAITAAMPDDGYFYLDDGTKLADASGFIGVRVYGTVTADSVGKMATVVGICQRGLIRDSYTYVITTREQSDIYIVPQRDP
jgi:hypothetical protein